MSMAARALSLLMADARLGGMIVRGDAEALLARIPGTIPVRRVPPGITPDALAGGLDVAGTLAAGKRVMQPGLIEAAAGGFLIVPMAERLSPDVIGLLTAALDSRALKLILLDSGGDDEVIADALQDRVAFSVNSERDFDAPMLPASADPARDVVGLAAMMGIASLRLCQFALRVAAAADLATAVALVLAPRAMQWPDAAPEPTPPGEGQADAQGSMADVVIEAVKAMLPADAIAAIVARNARAKGRGRGARTRTPRTGRPLGNRAGIPRSGARLALIDTLRAAVPWQRLRGRTGPVMIRKSDLRIQRLQGRSATTTIFAVDASGSAAAARLAEAKGAVELLLTRAYAERAQVALVAFRGEGAALLLPPTRSLTRARRLLADLPGGGTTPLGAGLEVARQVATAERARDRSPRIVVLTDGRANAPAGSAQAAADNAARAIARDSIATTLIDISARPRVEGQAVAAAMQARYIALPRADAQGVAAALSP